MEDEFSFIDDGEMIDPGENREGSRNSTQFQRGQSGNPRGRPKGSRNKATLAAEALLDGEAEARTRKAIELALNGDLGAIRLCLERLIPARRSRVIQFDLPETSTVEDVVIAYDAVLAAMADGEISPDEAATVAGVLESKRKAIETVELAEELNAMKSDVAEIKEAFQRREWTR